MIQFRIRLVLETHQGWRLFRVPVKPAATLRVAAKLAGCGMRDEGKIAGGMRDEEKIAPPPPPPPPVRSKSLINHFFHLGLCVSYDRVLELTKEYADNLVRDYNDNQVFCPSTLQTKVFSVIVKDNIDHNAKPTTATKNYHGGTNMTVMQFLSEDNSKSTNRENRR